MAVIEAIETVYLEADRTTDPAATVTIVTTLNNLPTTRNWRVSFKIKGQKYKYRLNVTQNSKFI